MNQRCFLNSSTQKQKTQKSKKIEKNIMKSMESLATKTDLESLATKTDLANVKTDIVKWMFIFWAGTVAISGILKGIGVL